MAQCHDVFTSSVTHIISLLSVSESLLGFGAGWRFGRGDSDSVSLSSSCSKSPNSSSDSSFSYHGPDSRTCCATDYGTPLAGNKRIIVYKSYIIIIFYTSNTDQLIKNCYASRALFELLSMSVPMSCNPLKSAAGEKIVRSTW